MKLKFGLIAIALTFLTSTSLTAHAQFAKMDDAVEYRQAALTVLETHFRRIGAVVKGEKAYDKTAVEYDANIVETMSKLPWSAFPAGSHSASSRAKPEVWTNAEKFKTASEKFQVEAAKLSAAAKSGDIGAIKTAFGDTGKSCKACHDDFKEKKRPQ